MQKELNPQLFGDRSTKASIEPAPVDALRATPRADTEMATFLNLDRQVLDVRTQISQMGEELRKSMAQTQEFMKSSHLRVERLQQQVQRLEQSHNGLVQDSSQKIAQMAQRLSERKNLDQKIQEMVDRHTQVIKSFEVRMNHLQRLLSEKEAQLVTAQSAINEARMELARLKMVR